VSGDTERVPVAAAPAPEETTQDLSAAADLAAARNGAAAQPARQPAAPRQVSDAGETAPLDQPLEDVWSRPATTPRRSSGMQRLLELIGVVRRPPRSPEPAPAPAQALQLAQPEDQRLPAGPERRAVRPLPWGRDFAAVVVHREDSLTAIFGKLDAADSPRVALVAPRGNEELAKPLGMRRLRRHIDMTGKDLMLVTHSGSLKSRAREVGLASVGNIRNVDFERYGRRGVNLGGIIVPLPGLGLFLRLAAFIAAIAVLGGAVLLYLPEATVQVYPQIQTLSNTAQITIGTAIASVNAATGDVPAHRRSTAISWTVYYPAHGQTTVQAPDGSNRTVPAVTDDDVKQATNLAQQVLLLQGEKLLQDRYKTETLFNQTATLNAFDSQADHQAGDAAPLVQVTASGQVTLLSADNDTLRQALLEPSLKDKIDASQMFVPSTFQVTVLSSGDYDKENNKLSAQVKLSEGVTRSFSVAGLRKALAGKSKRDAQQAIIDRVDQSKPAQIKLTPSWAPWLPRFTNRITVNVTRPSAPSATATPGPSPTPTPAPQ